MIGRALACQHASGGDDVRADGGVLLDRRVHPGEFPGFAGQAIEADLAQITGRCRGGQECLRLWRESAASRTTSARVFGPREWNAGKMECRVAPMRGEAFMVIRASAAPGDVARRVADRRWRPAG